MAAAGIVRQDYLIDSHDPGVKLHLREKKPRGMEKAEAAATLLMAHGQSTPSPVAFDLPLPGYSWMDFIAGRGFRVYALCVRGYGPSTRPPEMLRSPRGQPPAVRGITAVRDIDAAARFIRAKDGVGRLNLLGWSWGTTTTAAFTAANRARVRRLVLYAPFYAYDDPDAAALREDPARPGRWDPRSGAWRWVTERYQRARWDGSIPKGRHSKWRAEKAIRRFWTEQLRFDPEGARRRIPAVRVPNGAMADAYDRSRNKPLYDAAKITCPVLTIRGDHDRSSTDPIFAAAYRALTNSRGKRSVVLGDATHFAQYEWSREALYAETQNFLEG